MTDCTAMRRHIDDLKLRYEQLKGWQQTAPDKHFRAVTETIVETTDELLELDKELRLAEAEAISALRISDDA